jgi:hypothetical protein
MWWSGPGSIGWVNSGGFPAAMTAPASWVPGLSHDACAVVRGGER